MKINLPILLSDCAVFFVCMVSTAFAAPACVLWLEQAGAYSSILGIRGAEMAIGEYACRADAASNFILFQLLLVILMRIISLRMTRQSVLLLALLRACLEYLAIFFVNLFLVPLFFSPEKIREVVVQAITQYVSFSYVLSFAPSGGGRHEEEGAADLAVAFLGNGVLAVGVELGDVVGLVGQEVALGSGQSAKSVWENGEGSQRFCGCWGFVFCRYIALAIGLPRCCQLNRKDNQVAYSLKFYFEFPGGVYVTSYQKSVMANYRHEVYREFVEVLKTLPPTTDSLQRLYLASDYCLGLDGAFLMDVVQGCNPVTVNSPKIGSQAVLSLVNQIEKWVDEACVVSPDLELDGNLEKLRAVLAATKKGDEGEEAKEA